MEDRMDALEQRASVMETRLGVVESVMPEVKALLSLDLPDRMDDLEAKMQKALDAE